jgi:hypothetical protein
MMVRFTSSPHRPFLSMFDALPWRSPSHHHISQYFQNADLSTGDHRAEMITQNADLSPLSLSNLQIGKSMNSEAS